MEFDGIAVDGDVGRSGVVIARLTDGADVDHDLTGSEAVFEADLFGFEEVECICEDTGDVGVSLEAGFFDKGEDFFHLHLIVDVVGEDVFVEWIASGSVDVEGFGGFIAIAAVEFTEEVPAAFGAGAGGSFEDGAGPEDGTFGGSVEADGVEECGLIVVTEQAEVEVHHQIDAFSRVGAVADDVPQTKDLGDPFAANVGKHCLQGFQIAVDVADQGSQGTGPDITGDH